MNALAPIAAAIALCLSGASGCSQDSEPESDLGGLLHTRDTEGKAIDVAKASDDMGELRRAAALGHSRVAKALGAHRASTIAKSSVRSGSDVVDGVETTTKLAIAEDGHFSLTAHNDKEYGRDAIFDGKTLYLRPRYGKYHARAPEMSSEPQALLDKFGMTTAAHLDLLGPGAAIRRASDKMVAGRAAVEIELEKADTPAKRPSEALVQRKWRESATTESISGTIALDKETGVLLAATLKGELSYTRDGQNFVMVLEVTHSVADIGKSIGIEVPAPEQRLSSPMTSKELDEREELLEGIAPPAKRGKTPDNPRGDARATDATKK